ncbi:MAG: cupin domain-containing protein [Bacteroidales bacterium]|nr:cupin domain-containing protein [Bacteroidales bacterium]
MNIKPSTNQHISTSAHQHINTSTHQHINSSAHQHINTSAHQLISTSTHQLISTSTHQHINQTTQPLHLNKKRPIFGKFLCMKNIVSGIFLLFGSTILAQNGAVESGVYPWNNLEVKKQETQDVRSILEGTTRDLELIQAEAITLFPGETPDMKPAREPLETMFIIKEGTLEVSIREQTKLLGPGSIIMIMPGDPYEISNPKSVPATFYIINFIARKPVDLERGANAGGSFMVDFKELEFKPHDKGGLRNYYKRSTAMFENADMHVTTLNGHIKSHEPHTHSAAEIVLMISGNSQMQIGDKIYQATAGDLYYLESNVSHAIQNTGDEACMYYAFQWE